MDEFRGTVERITFRNEENFYTVLRLTSDTNSNDIVTAVGIFPTVNVGETLVLSGKWATHSEYGRQFQTEAYRVEIPATIKGIEKYLGSGLVSGIGPVTAKRLVKHFGVDIVRIIEEEPARLVEVDGIGENRAENIAQSFKDHKQIRDIMIFLQGYGVSPGYATRIFKHYGYETVRVIQSNPYRLADEVFGIGFKTADKLALESGIESSSIQRLTAGLKYVMQELAGDGHTHVPQQELLGKAAQMLGVDEGSLSRPLIHLQQHKDIVSDTRSEGDPAVYLAPYYHAEVGVSRMLANLSNWHSTLGISHSVGDEITAFERQRGITLAPEQRAAVEQAMNNGVLVITGGPGTGKTTIVRCLIDLFAAHQQQVLLAAPTGRAAKRLGEATGKYAQTIHRLLEYRRSEDGRMEFGRNENTPLTADIVIIDEVSMVDLLLMYSLLKAIPQGCRLILVGDVDQLPSVGAGNVLRDVIESGVIPVSRLKTIFRQAQESMIVVNAHRINNGDFPYTNNKDKDFFFMIEEEPEKILEQILGLCKFRLPRFKNWHPIDDIQVLTPMRRTLIGVANLNLRLQEVLNPPMQGKNFMKYGLTTFRQGDKVMQIRNNYTKEVFNGDVGRIIDVDRETSTVKVAFQETGGTRVTDYDFGEMDELVLAYATSVHKSQGSEYPVVVMPVSTQHFLMLQRNLLYTSITRAKELVVLIGTKKALAIAIKNNKVEERYSLLASRLRESSEYRVSSS